ncbi:cytochrome P450 CYP72A219-like [Salvia miltiorrhiza]|uniref:cytochrome P450 CYP72A219-like n=1 Tax=Salvia miltiorrhiza TaxID=226208 RepID=UPI0025AC508F|nr:cytochrome P450 CYP72A219-like [Salvia miltiorrhiza]
MNTTLGLVLTSVVVAASIACAVNLLNLLWIRPRKLEKLLRNQGLNGNPYRPILGDTRDYAKAMKAQQLRSIQLSDDILPHVFGYFHTILDKYGPNSFLWFGPWPRLNVTDPELIREILRNPGVYQKPLPEMGKILTGGLVVLEGEKWAKHRKIVNPAFHLDKLKSMVPAMVLSCSKMIEKWEAMVSGSDKGWCEIDVWSYLEDLTGDVISRTAFGGSHEEGSRIFQLQKEKLEISLPLLQLIVIPGWRYLPTKVNRRLSAITREVQSLLRGMIDERQKAAAPADDLLGLLMESSSRSVEESGNKKGGMSIEDVMEECKLFYFAGSETTSSLLVWTMVLLCMHPEWQTRAREEVNRVMANSEPAFEALNHLKAVTMILQEALRMYPPLPLTARGPTETVKVGDLTIPKGVHMTLLIGQVHYDPEIWGEDAREFKPQRFEKGIPDGAKMKAGFIPFGSGPRACIGQNMAMMEAKVALAMILRRFSFQLSPSYVHAPFSLLTLQPQHGAPMILRSLHS